MNDLEIKVSKETRLVSISKKTIGNDGENLQEKLIFTFIDEFVDGIARLEYEINNESYYLMLNKENNAYTLPISNLITKAGMVNMQLVITGNSVSDEIPIFKSNCFTLFVEKSVNADIEQPSEYLSWMDMANDKINKIDNLDIGVSKTGARTMISITKSDGAVETVEVLDGKTGPQGPAGPIGTNDYNDLINQPTIPTKTSELINDSDFVTNITSDLINYYLKTEIYNKAEINHLINSISTVNIQVVEELPELGENNIIYLVKKDGELNDIHNEYVWTDDWELIGTTQIDLTGYAKEEWITQQISNFLTTEQINLLIVDKLNNYYTKSEVDEKINSIPISDLLHYKGHFASYEDLPSTGQASGTFSENDTPTKNITSANILSNTKAYTPITSYGKYWLSYWNVNVDSFNIMTDYPEQLEGVCFTLGGGYVWLAFSFKYDPNKPIYVSSTDKASYSYRSQWWRAMGNSVGSVSIASPYKITEDCVFYLKSLDRTYGNMDLTSGNTWLQGNFPDIKFLACNRIAHTIPTTPTSSNGNYTKYLNSLLNGITAYDYNYVHGMKIFRFDENCMARFVTNVSQAKENDLATVGEYNDLYRCDDTPKWVAWSERIETYSKEEIDEMIGTIDSALTTIIEGGE